MKAGILDIHFPHNTDAHQKMNILYSLENGSTLMNIHYYHVVVAFDTHSFNTCALLSIYSSHESCFTDHIFSASKNTTNH